MKRIGILGGMGPLATIDLYAKIVELTNAAKDQDNIPIVIDNHPQIPDRTAYILHGGEDPFPFMKESATRLKNAGCEAICIAKIATASIKSNFPHAKKIAVIATTGTTAAKIYENELIAAGLECVKIPENLMTNIMDCIYKGAKANKLKEYVGLFNETIAAIEADAYIAACTEIPLFLPYATKKDKFVDATLELAKAAVKFGLEK